jgi:hypothetical protein
MDAALDTATLPSLEWLMNQIATIYPEIRHMILVNMDTLSMVCLISTCTWWNECDRDELWRDKIRRDYMVVVPDHSHKNRYKLRYINYGYRVVKFRELSHVLEGLKIIKACEDMVLDTNHNVSHIGRDYIQTPICGNVVDMHRYKEHVHILTYTKDLFVCVWRDDQIHLKLVSRSVDRLVNKSDYCYDDLMYMSGDVIYRMKFRAGYNYYNINCGYLRHGFSLSKYVHLEEVVNIGKNTDDIDRLNYPESDHMLIIPVAYGGIGVWNILGIIDGAFIASPYHNVEKYNDVIYIQVLAMVLKGSMYTMALCKDDKSTFIRIFKHPHKKSSLIVYPGIAKIYPNAFITANGDLFAIAPRDDSDAPNQLKFEIIQLDTDVLNVDFVTVEHGCVTNSCYVKKMLV